MRKRTVRLIGVCVSAAMLAGTCAAAFAGCAGVQQGDTNIGGWVDEDGNISVTEDVTIDFWGWGGQAEQDIYQTMCNVFMSQHPNFTINYTGYTSAQYVQNLTNAANDMPDVFYMPDTEFLSWVTQGVLWDFSEYVSQEELSAIWEEGYDRYYYDSETHALGYSESETVGLYALPKDIGPFQFCYNETLLRQALEHWNTQNPSQAVTYEDFAAQYFDENDPMTWEEFIAVGAMLKPWCDSQNKYVLSHYELYAALYSNNADFVTDDGSASRIDEPQFAAALQYMHDLAFEHGLMAGSAGSSTTTGYSSFIGGNSIFSFLGPWDCATVWGTTPTSPNPLSYTLKLVPVPYGPGTDDVYGTQDDGDSVCQVGSMGYAISANNTTSALQRAAALQFVKWLCYDEDAQRTLYQLGQQTPNIIEMAQGEYLEMETVQSYMGTTVQVNPSNLSVFLNVIDGTGEKTAEGGGTYTDKVGGRMRTQVRTLRTEWYNEWSTVVSNYNFWTDAEATGAGLVAAFRDVLQGWLDDYNATLGR